MKTIRNPGLARIAAASIPFVGAAIIALLLIPIPTVQACGPYCDMMGGDKAAYYVNNAVSCQAMCDQASYCRGWTWVKPGVQGPKAVCYLKAVLKPARRSDCCISGYRGDHTAAASVRQFRLGIPNKRTLPPARPAQRPAQTRPVARCNCKDNNGRPYEGHILGQSPSSSCGPDLMTVMNYNCTP
jgi:hypothetical protein